MKVYMKFRALIIWSLINTLSDGKIVKTTPLLHIESAAFWGMECLGNKAVTMKFREFNLKFKGKKRFLSFDIF